MEPHGLQLPRDHAAHEDYRIEWWYYTGSVQATDGRQFGYQLTFFRTGVTPHQENPSRWAIRDLYTAHFAVSDVAGREFLSSERLRRSGIGWAGAETARYRVWNGDWEASLDGDVHRLRAKTDDASIELNLSPQKPPVLHGRQGLSRKGPTPGNASHYYSLTRLQTTGQLTIRGRTFPVEGFSWMDHEFSTSFLEPGQQGWDWLSLQLDDRRELMLYRIRRSDGTLDPASSGTLVAADGSTTPLSLDNFVLVPGSTWRSSRTGGVYPVEWTVRLPGQDANLTIRAAFPEQELDSRATTGLAYWEGSIAVEGTWAGQAVHGHGYLEMTGYAGRALGTHLTPSSAPR